MTRHIDLNGTWKLRWDDGQRGDRVARLTRPDADLSRAIDATVPGEVHLDLIKHGVIQEPCEGANVLAARWVEETFWRYRRTFQAPNLAKGERAWLMFEALDLAAVIYLNGKEVGRHANVFYPCCMEVTAQLVPGENVIVVEVESGLFHAMDRSTEGMGIDNDSRLTKRPWLRKPQSEHGWDWAPRLLNVGILGSVRLEIARTVRTESYVVLSELSDDFAAGTVTARVFAEGLEVEPCQGKLTVTVKETRQREEVAVIIQPGMNRLEACLRVDHPNLWWPIGHGGQPRYTVNIELNVAGEEVGVARKMVGFRHVRVNQASHPEMGRYFVLEINGKPIFCKGGNFVPADPICARIDGQRYAQLVERAIEANFNLLRVWGGGMYEHDEFYELCDAHGILVWQEFIFACAKYPATDEQYLADVKREATYQIRRLAHHPSLVVWCGNNEMEEGNWNWGYDRGVAHPDYALFHLVLPRLLNEEDGTHYYQPSSPFSPDHANPSRDDVGDQHPWSVGFRDTDFRRYRQMICRFPNEGGILGPTALPTVRACLEQGIDRPGSFAWEIHDNSVAYSGKSQPYPDAMLEQWLGKPLSEMSIEDYVYWAGVVQGEGLSEYVKNFRRRMFSSAAAIFWMYNDCWPATRSWTIVDYYLRRTPAFWPVRRAFAAVTVVVVREGDRVKVFGVNEGTARQGRLRHGIMQLSGGYPLDKTESVELLPNASTLLAEFDARRWDELGINTHAAFALLTDEAGREVARDRLFLPLFKELQWPRSRVTVNCRDGMAIFCSEAFAWRVCLDLDGECELPDNFFDVWPGVPTVLPWPEQWGPPRIIRIGNPDA